MRERGIIFSAPMVRALLAGTKTQTRRLPRVQHRESLEWRTALVDQGWVMDGHRLVACPYGVPGDKLWVREAWRALKRFDSYPPRDIPAGSMIAYEADAPAGDYQPAPLGRMGKLRPGMFMPRWASRITSELSQVRAQRLQGISPEDAQAEGLVEGVTCLGRVGYGLPGWDSGLVRTSPVDAYEWLWDSINGERAPWESNPFVWVLNLTPYSSR